MEIGVFWDVTPCNLTGIYRRFTCSDADTDYFWKVEHIYHTKRRHVWDDSYLQLFVFVYVIERRWAVWKSKYCSTDPFDYDLGFTQLLKEHMLLNNYQIA